jgi:hypothetical protein
MSIIGSKSLTHHFKDFSRIPKDTDLIIIIGTKSDVDRLITKLNPNQIKYGKGITSLIGIQNKDDFFNTNNVEILLSEESESLTKYVEYDGVSDEIKYASLEVLFSLKKSHIHFPIKFDKHISDYTLLYKSLGGIDKLENISKLNYKETELRLGKLKTPSLNKSVSSFFNQSNKFVKYFFVHDDIHQAVSHLDKPLYSYMQEDPTMAKCDKSLWDNFSYENKCKCVLEEAYVISLERKVLPSIFGGSRWVSSKQALDWSLMRVCTNLCSGWFRQFATDNYFSIKEYVNDTYVEDFLTKYKNGDICRI